MEKDPIKGTDYSLDYSLEVTTPAQMEAFLKEFNLEMIEISEYLNEVESMINKERDIFIKSKELNKDFESRKGNLDNFAKNLDTSRSEEITKIEAELNEEIEAADQIKIRINEESVKLQAGFTEVDSFDAKLREESLYKSLGTAYNRMKSEYDKMDSITTRDVSKEYETVLNESKNAASIDGGKDVVNGHDKLEGDAYDVVQPIETSTEEDIATVDGKK